jgi:transitional endoplasmic reticulum ATPase
MAVRVQCLVDHSPDPLDFTAYLHPTKMSALGISDGGFIRIRASPSVDAFASAKGNPNVGTASSIKLNRCFLVNLNAYLGQIVQVEPAACPPASKVVLAPVQDTLAGVSANVSELVRLATIPFGRLAVQPKFILPIYVLNRVVELQVMECLPATPVAIPRREVLTFSDKPTPRRLPRRFDSIFYDDIGGLPSQIDSLRFLIEIPLLQPAIHRSLGIKLPRGILITGGEGCGKTFLGKAIANETPAEFVRIQGLDLLTRSAEDAAFILFRISDRAIARAPSIVFIDDLDQVLREPSKGQDFDYRLTYAVVAVIDRLLSKPDIAVIGASRDPALIPGFLRAAHRFGHQIELPPPTQDQKIEIARTMLRSMGIPHQWIESLASQPDMKTGADIRMKIDSDILDQLSAIFAKKPVGTSTLTVAEIQSIRISAPLVEGRPAGPFGSQDAVPFDRPASGDPFGRPTDSFRAAVSGDPLGSPQPHGDIFGAFPAKKPTTRGSTREPSIKPASRSPPPRAQAASAHSPKRQPPLPPDPFDPFGLAGKAPASRQGMPAPARAGAPKPTAGPKSTAPKKKKPLDPFAPKGK